jgi:hypothetical protein
MEYLKKAEPIGEQVTRDIRETVSELSITESEAAVSDFLQQHEPTTNAQP